MARLLCSVFLFLHLLRTSSAGSSSCYYSDGEVSQSDYPCDPNAKESVCCGGGLGSVCLDNKLCQGANGNVIRGSCTDQTWGSAQCAQYCLGADTGGTDLISCSNVTKTDTSYCCDHTLNCCDTGVGRFEVLPSQPGVWATWNRQSTRYDVVGTLFEQTTTTTTTTSSTSTSITTSTTMSTTSSTTTTATMTAAPTPTDSASDAQPPEMSTAVKVGIGVGSGVGAVLVAAVAYLLWKMHKHDKKMANGQPSEWAPFPHQPLPTTAATLGRGGGVYDAWHQSHGNAAPKEPQQRQGLHGHQRQGYDVWAELPAGV